MTRQITTCVAKLDRLLSLWIAYSQLDLTDDGSFEAARKLIRAHNELLDHCVDCGMDPAADEFEFAARVSTQHLLAA